MTKQRLVVLFAAATIVLLAAAVATCVLSHPVVLTDLQRRLLSMPRKRGGVAVTPKPGTSRLFVSFCPDSFTNRLAVVDVESSTGKWSILGTAKMPSAIFGCSALYDPIYSFDPAVPSEVLLDITEDAGAFVFNTVGGADDITVQAFNSRSLFFSGFLSFHLETNTKQLVGITALATETGYCSDACIGFGRQNMTGSDRERSTPLPYRAIADDTSYLDRKAQVFYAQASHPLQEACAPLSWMDCMLAIDAQTGKLLSTRYNPNEHCYRFGPAEVPTAEAQRRAMPAGTVAASSPIVMAFVVGMNSRCNRTESETSYAFAEVALATSNFTLVSCASAKVVIHEGPWISSFSLDSRMFVTSSGSGDGDDPQFLAYDVASGAVMVNTRLSGLAKALKADMNLIFVWAVQAF